MLDEINNKWENLSREERKFEMNNSSCIVSLTGDPITVGHRDIIKRASKMFNFIYVLIIPKIINRIKFRSCIYLE